MNCCLPQLSHLLRLPLSPQGLQLPSWCTLLGGWPRRTAAQMLQQQGLLEEHLAVPCNAAACHQHNL
jgi:hypothetical protein